MSLQTRIEALAGAIGTGLKGLTSRVAAVETDPRWTDARTPTAHQHPIDDLTATGTRSASTFLRGDGTFNVPYAVVTQAEAEAGSSTTARAWTPVRVKQAIDYHEKVFPVDVATITNTTLSGLATTVDGVTLSAGMVVLVRNQLTPSQNGVYVAATGAWTRHPAYSTSVDLAGSLVRVRRGSTYGGKLFLSTMNADQILGTDLLLWDQVPGFGDINARYPTEAMVATGTIFESGLTSAPAGSLPCDGTVRQRTGYQALFAAIGTRYNTGGETASEFRLPLITVPNKVVVGSFLTPTLVAGTEYAQAITYGYTFGSAPNVQVSTQFGTTGSGGIYANIGSTPTTTGVTINYRRASGTLPFTVNWSVAGPVNSAEDRNYYIKF